MPRSLLDLAKDPVVQSLLEENKRKQQDAANQTKRDQFVEDFSRLPNNQAGLLSNLRDMADPRFEEVKQKRYIEEDLGIVPETELGAIRAEGDKRSYEAINIDDEPSSYYKVREPEVKPGIVTDPEVKDLAGSIKNTQPDNRKVATQLEAPQPRANTQVQDTIPNPETTPGVKENVETEELDQLETAENRPKQNDDVLQRILNRQEPETLASKFSFVDALKQAQVADNEARIASLYRRAGERIGAGISNREADQQFLKDQDRDINLASDRTKDVIGAYQTQQKYDANEIDMSIQQDLQDPNSEISAIARKRLNDVLKLNVPDTVSAAQLDKLGLLKSLAPQQRNLRLERVYDPVKKQGVYKYFDTNTGEIIPTDQIPEYAPMVGTNPWGGQTALLPRSDINYTNQFLQQRPFGEQPTQNVPGMQQPGQLINAPGQQIAQLGQPQQETNNRDLLTEQPKVSKSQNIWAKLPPKFRDQVSADKKEFARDIEDARKGMVAANTTRLILQHGGKVGDILRSIQNQLARASGEVGVMTDKDVAPFGGRQGILERLGRMVQYGVTGKLPAADRQFLSQLSEAMENAGRVGLLNRSKYHVDNVSGKYGLTIPEATTILGVESASMPRDKSREVNSNAGKTVRVKGKLYKVAEDGDTLIPVE